MAEQGATLGSGPTLLEDMPTLQPAAGSGPPVPSSDASDALRLKIYSPHQDNPPLLAAWDRLADHASEPNPFAESWYVLPGIKEFDAANRVRLYALWQGDTDLVGLIPLVEAPRYGRFPIAHQTNWLHANCFLGTPLIRQGWEQCFWDAILTALDQDEQVHTLFYMAGLVEGGPVHRGLEEASAVRGRGCDTVYVEQRAMIETQMPVADYWDDVVRGKKRKELRRQFSRLAELGDLRFVSLANDAAIEPWIAQFLALERAGWKGEAGSALGSSHDTEQFFVGVVKAAHARGRLDGLALWLDDRPIAMLFHFIAGEGGFSFKTAYDQDYARYSPGVLIQRENLGLIARRNLAWIDSCAAPNHPMINSLWKERRAVIRLAVSIGGWKDQLMFNGVRSLERLRAWSKGQKGNIKKEIS